MGTANHGEEGLGDCCADALASVRGEPLLFKGDDFVHTDVTRVDVDAVG